MRFDPVAAAIARRQKAGLCPLCGGPLSLRHTSLLDDTLLEADPVCLNSGCRKAPPRRIKYKLK